jgi:predicted acylesterase/phospholipase RssA
MRVLAPRRDPRFPGEGDQRLAGSQAAAPASAHSRCLIPRDDMTPINEKRSALVLAGAGVKGAFEAGAIAALARARAQIVSIVGSSSGALNGTYYAAAVRAGKERLAGEDLARFWIEEAQWRNFLQLSPTNIVRGRGVSTSGKIERLLHERIVALLPGARRDVELRILLTALQGVDSWGPDLAVSTSHEYVQRFRGPDFEDAEKVVAAVHAAAASSAVPGLFAPVPVAGVGDCADGGIVNITPIQHALEDPTIDRVFVVVPWPSEAETGALSSVRLAMHLIDILVGERLCRELDEVNEMNRRIAAVERLAAANEWSELLFRQFKEALGLRYARQVEIVAIRPDIPLAGNPFTALRSKGLRKLYVQYGRDAAERALASLRPSA